MGHSQHVSEGLCLCTNKILFKNTEMGLEIILLSEGSQTQKHKYHMISLICGMQKKRDINKHLQNRKSYRFGKKKSYGYQVVRWEGRDKLGDRDSYIHTVLCYA